MKKGDIFYIKGLDDESKEPMYHVYKVLVNEKQFNTIHVLGYEPISNQPTKDDIHNVVIRIFHMPIAADGFGETILLDNQPVEDRELSGYIIYDNPSILNDSVSNEDWEKALSDLNKKSED